MGGGGGAARSFSGGGGGASRSAPAIRSAPSFSGPSRSAPAVRSAPAISSGVANKSGPPTIRSATAAPKINPSNAANVTKSASKFDPAVRQASAIAPAKNVGPNNLGPNKNVGSNSNLANNLGKAGPNANKNNPVRTANNWNNHNHNNNYYYDHGRWHGGYYGYHNHHHHDHSFWPFFAYAAFSNLFAYHPFGWNNWGYYPYAGYYWQPEVIYVDNSTPAIINASDGSATIDVRLPDVNAAVWIDDSETASQGTSRRYTTPRLRAGSDYSYTITASWTEDGETRTIARQVPLQAGSRVTLDFTQTPSRLTVNPGRE